MKKEKLEEKIENLKLLGRACIFIPYFTALYAKAIIGQEIRGLYYKTFKIPFAVYDDGEFMNYIRLDKEQIKKK
jgi:hypothetical protein